MRELKIISENQESAVLNWEQSDLANEYIIEGMTPIFTYVAAARVKNCCYIYSKDSNFIGYRVLYVAKNATNKNDFESIIDTTNTVFVKKELKPMEIIPIKAPDNKISLSFRSSEHFDLYRLYDDEGKLVCETEDCIVIGSFKKSYYVNGLKKTENGYVLEGASKKTVCTPINIKPQKTVLSIVIPVYNSQNFLPRTVQSILSSTFTDFEIILVNDGSKDNSKALCDWYAKNFDFIKAVHQENKGVCSARNKGMDIAKGQWLAFVDNDDIVHPYMYEKLYNSAKLHNTEIAIAQCIMHEDYEKSSFAINNRSDNNEVIMNSCKEVVEAKGSKNNIYFVAIWNKIVKIETARKVRFNTDLLYYEDTAYTMPLYTYINKFLMVKDAYYIWDKRKQKTEGTASNSHVKRPPEIVWKHYFLSYAAPLFIGNKDEEIANVYKYDILVKLLSQYSGRNWSNPIRRVMQGMIKYFVREYGLQVEQLKDTQLIEAWKEIEKSNTIEYDGSGDIPKEYYK